MFNHLRFADDSIVIGEELSEVDNAQSPCTCLQSYHVHSKENKSDDEHTCTQRFCDRAWEHNLRSHRLYLLGTEIHPEGKASRTGDKEN